MILQATVSFCPAAEIVHNWRWPSGSGTAFWTGATTGGSTTMTSWLNLYDANDTNRPSTTRLTETEPNSAFWVELGKGIRLTSEAVTAPAVAVTNTPSGDWYITAPFSFVGAIPDQTQTMDPCLAPLAITDYSARMDMDNGGSAGNRVGRIFNFRDLRFQGLLGGWRPTQMHIAGKVTLTGPTALSASRDGGYNDWYLDAELDASAVSEILAQYWTRELSYPPVCGIRLRSSPTWFSGKWVLDTRIYADVAGCLGDADIQINGAGTPGLMKSSRVQSSIPWPWIDRRSGNLWITAANAASRNAKWTIDTTSVVSSPATYGTATSPYSAANPQCPGGKVYVASAASPVYVRELWVDGVQKANGTYYATSTANNAWFGTVTGTTYAGHIIVTGGTTRNVTMAAVLDPGAVADANLAVYPAAGLTKAFLEGYTLNIKANDPIVTSAGIGYKFVNWTTSTGSGLANANAAKTTLTVPSGTDITVTAHYVIAVTSPTPADGASQVAMSTGLDWTPALPTGTQAIYFGTNSSSLSFIKSYPDGSAHGATNAEIGGLLKDTTTYYWRVDTNGQPGATWQFRTEQRRPYIPVPADGATNIERITPNLSWNTGHASATSWDVYFGSSQSAVANAANTSDPTFLATRLVSDVNEPNAPAGLRINTTYYWRVDEHNTYGTLKGFVWNFTTRGPICMGIGMGDIDGDCKVTFVDFALVASSFFNN